MGGIAQLVERLVRNEKVRGSNPLTSTNFAPRNSRDYSGDEMERAGGRDIDGRANRPNERERMSQSCSTGGARSAGFKAKLKSWSQSAALDNPLASTNFASAKFS